MPDDPRPSQQSGSGTGDLVRHVPAVILALLILAFAIDNRRDVTIGFVFTDKKVPLFLVLVATAVVGAIVGALLRRRRN